MVINPVPACSRCGLADKTYKVSLIYLEASARLNRRETDHQPELDGLIEDLYPDMDLKELPVRVLKYFVSAFAPPSGGKKITRRLHPDGVVAFFTFVLFVLIFQIAITQPGFLPIAALLLVTGLVVYFLFRKQFVDRFENQYRQELDENLRVEMAVDRWMKLYYCSRDQGVFDPGTDQLVPLERMSDFLREP